MMPKFATSASFNLDVKLGSGNGTTQGKESHQGVLVLFFSFLLCHGCVTTEDQGQDGSSNFVRYDSLPLSQ
jgi:hypothetical protein